MVIVLGYDNTSKIGLYFIREQDLMFDSSLKILKIHVLVHVHDFVHVSQVLVEHVI